MYTCKANFPVLLALYRKKSFFPCDFLTWAVFVFTTLFLVRRPFALSPAKLGRGVVAHSGSHHRSRPTGGAAQSELRPMRPISVNYSQKKVYMYNYGQIESVQV